MSELPPQLRLVRDFFFKEALSLPPESSYLHRPGLIKDQTIFRLEDLRRHLNNPFLDLDFLQIVDRGQLVDLRPARCVKIVQRRPIEFVNRRVLQQHLEKGAACLLEGVDILEPQVSLLAATLDRAHSCTFSNAVVFFSQRGSEAYRGHLDTDDVLALHLAGAKKWRLHARQAPRRTHLVELGESEMGPLETEIVMRPGDALYLRSGTPHRVETVGDYSMHLSFDLCDRGAVIETVFDLLLKHYDRDALRPNCTVQEVLAKVAGLGRTEGFRRDAEALQQQHKADYEEFRSIAASRVSFFDNLISAEQAGR
jgi:quercetin dioxygenase-like cupin family protein